MSSSATSYAPGASVSTIGYASHNALKTETYGNGLIHANTHNNRLQPSEIKLGTSGNPTSVVSLTYNYGTTNNNGNVQSLGYSGGGLSYTQSFGYDQLNRLTTSNENGGASWSQTNGYDRYGNRWIDLGGGNQSLYFNTSNNRISGWSYDSVGNLLNDGNHTYTYDAENKIRNVDGAGAYTYDGEGQRVRKLLAENIRLIYDVAGQLIGEFNGATGALKKEYIYGASGLVATIEPIGKLSNGTRYITADSLGSPRVVTNSLANVVSRHDYKPYGEELGAGIGGRTTGIGYIVNDGLRQKFTSYERDSETGLDYAQARYYSNQQGRFTSADPLMASANAADPQSFNRYTYAVNSPITTTDPSGMLSMNMTSAMGQFARNFAGGYWTNDPSGPLGGVDYARTQVELTEPPPQPETATVDSANIVVASGTIQGQVVDNTTITFTLNPSQTEEVFGGEPFQVNVKLWLPETVAKMTPTSKEEVDLGAKAKQDNTFGSKLVMHEDSNFSAARPSLVDKAKRRPAESAVTFTDVMTTTAFRSSTASFKLTASSDSLSRKNSFFLKLQGQSEKGKNLYLGQIRIRIEPAKQ